MTIAAAQVAISAIEEGAAAAVRAGPVVVEDEAAIAAMAANSRNRSTRLLGLTMTARTSHRRRVKVISP